MHETAEGAHWDLLLPVAGQTSLATWRLAANPVDAPACDWPIAAQRIADHRPLYLEYEGEISGGRGRVRRIDRGSASVRRHSSDRWRVRLVGETLSGEFVLSPAHGAGTFARLDSAKRGRPRSTGVEPGAVVEPAGASAGASFAGDALRPVEAWFTRRGWRPFEFQRAAWRAYLAGESGLIHAPTGVGKTLAVWMGPLLEALASTDGAVRGRGAPGLRVLWITPLRALARDSVAALQEPLAELAPRWTVELRTGDTSSTVRRRQRERLPTALVTTPESLSVLLSHADTRGRFADLRCVFVDEWHELLGTKRGVQTELGLARLRSWLPELRTWGLSATLGNLGEAMQVLLGAHAGAGRLLSADLPKTSEILTLIPDEIESYPWSGHIGLRLLSQVVESIEAARSTLLFTNTRSQAEIWFQALLRARPDWLGSVALHHGSLDRKIRDQVERRLAAGALRCVVCTSSLDLGVDFTPVDQVFQIGSPKGIARLLQRAGRSGHQPGARSRVVCVPAHAFELVEFAAARQAWQERAVEARTPVVRALDVLAQHLVTVGAGGGFEAEALRDEVRTTHAYRELTDAEWDWALEFAASGGPTLRAYPQYARLVLREGRYEIATPRLAAQHRLGIGTISSDASLKVAYVTGRALGTIEESFIGRLAPGDVFVFAGRTLRLVRVCGMTVVVRPARETSGVVPRWNGARFPLSTRLAEAVRRQLSAAREGRYESSEMQAVQALLELQRRQSCLPAPDELLIERAESRDGAHAFLFPFEGRLVHEGLAGLLAWRWTQRQPCSLHVTATDYGLELLSAQPLPEDEATWRALLTPEGLADDLLACLNAGQLARRQFRDIARIAGLILPGYPGAPRPARQLQASSELFFDVFAQFDAGNLLLEQARREVMEQQLEVTRLRDALVRLAGCRLRLVATGRFSPLAFPLWAERLRAQQLSSEKWSDRVRRMSAQLTRQAEREA